MGKANVNIGIHNKYELTLLGPKNKIKAKAYAYNVVLDSFWDTLFSGRKTNIYKIAIGTGTGTPATTDTGLFNELTSVLTNFISHEKALPTSHCIVSSTFPANASYVGIITEVGIKTIQGYYLSHALLEDAEGNIITINKTDVDILIVTATIYLTIEAVSPLELLAPIDQSLTDFISDNNNGLNISYSMWSKGYLCSNNPYNSIFATFVGSVMIQNRTIAAATKTITYTTTRETADSAINGYMVNALLLCGLGYIMLPNALYFTPYETAYIVVGTGDGVTTEFACPIPDFVKDTETIKVAGTVMTRSTDYTVDNLGNSIFNPTAKTAYSTLAKISGGIKISSRPSNVALHTLCFFVPDTQYFPLSLTDDKPLIFDCGIAVTCNTIYLKALIYFHTYDTISGTISLDYSTDNENWSNAWTSDIISDIIGYNGLGTLETNIGTLIPNGPKFTFTAVTARYWRLRFTLTSGTTPLAGGIAASNGGVRPIAAAGYQSFFGYTGPGIVFTTAPAAGASILIKAQVDRPWKTADYVIDTSYSLTL